MTTEQIIVFGFIAAAFVAGWIASLVTRRQARLANDLPPPRVEAVTEMAQEAHRSSLADEVGEALRSDAANDGMLSVLRADEDAGLSELELDLADWGFTYGVAWARARERAQRGPDEAVARDALDAAERVFRAYTAGEDWTRRDGEDSSNGSGPEPPDERG